MVLIHYSNINLEQTCIRNVIITSVVFTDIFKPHLWESLEYKRNLASLTQKIKD